MSTRLNPYIAFDGNAKEAMEFYRDVFGGSLTISTFGEFGNDDPAVADKTMHAMLEADNGLTLMASDGPPGVPLTRMLDWVADWIMRDQPSLNKPTKYEVLDGVF